MKETPTVITAPFTVGGFDHILRDSVRYVYTDVKNTLFREKFVTYREKAVKITHTFMNVLLIFMLDIPTVVLQATTIALLLFVVDQLVFLDARGCLGSRARSKAARNVQLHSLLHGTRTLSNEKRYTTKQDYSRNTRRLST